MSCLLLALSCLSCLSRACRGDTQDNTLLYVILRHVLPALSPLMGSLTKGCRRMLSTTRDHPEVSESQRRFLSVFFSRYTHESQQLCKPLSLGFDTESVASRSLLRRLKISTEVLITAVSMKYYAICNYTDKTIGTMAEILK
jgi:hypothetical protein